MRRARKPGVVLATLPNSNALFATSHAAAYAI